MSAVSFGPQPIFGLEPLYNLRTNYTMGQCRDVLDAKNTVWCEMERHFNWHHPGGREPGVLSTGFITVVIATVLILIVPFLWRAFKEKTRPYSEEHKDWPAWLRAMNRKWPWIRPRRSPWNTTPAIWPWLIHSPAFHSHVRGAVLYGVSFWLSIVAVVSILGHFLQG